MENKPTNKKNYIKLASYLLFFIFAIELVIVGVIAIRSNPQIKNTITLATTVKPETFTELYFEDHTKLPHTLTVSEQYSFRFTIHNLENRDMNYPYEFYVDLGKDKLMLDKGNVFIKKDGYKTISRTFVVNDVLKRSRFVVNLINKDQHISFWAEATK